MVGDGLYSGSYASVTVTKNVIVGSKSLNLGIGIGANVWFFNGRFALTRPATITGNLQRKHYIPYPVGVIGPKPFKATSPSHLEYHQLPLHSSLIRQLSYKTNSLALATDTPPFAFLHEV